METYFCFVATEGLSSLESLPPLRWDIRVVTKYIADPTMHSMPAATPSTNQMWLACQSMDNIIIFSSLNRFEMNHKKTFSRHVVAGYACTLDFSPDMRCGAVRCRELLAKSSAMKISS
ncbi:pre-mRNA-processing factor 17-like [Zootermopsis nevadensis]|uniref:Pre-mRNA-processing factor 17 n=1 Tax=Zootermopsis nevadensis TaxID=136037 RepID=A0A067QY65_ZOONE|nr:pre-mRNA-processing factor 17-like [Zootermopsis nevadensis]KDR15257.1 Pre-mRNA-processing factor 17 [Zootermopsis nevadensis]